MTAATISSGSVVSRQIGKASTPPNSLNSIALPSITGSAASRADVAEAQHRRPVGDDRDVVLLDRVAEGLVRVVADREADPRHAGRVGHREVVARLQRLLVALGDLAALVQAEACGRSASSSSAPCTVLDGLDDVVPVLLVARVDRDVADQLAAAGLDDVDRPDLSRRPGRWPR